MAIKTNGTVVKGTYQLYTPLNGVTATTTSSQIPVAGARKITLFLTRANHGSGSSKFEVQVSGDDDTFVAFNKLVDNVTNTNAQNLTRVASVTLSSNTTSIVSMDLEHDTFVSMKVKVTETTDGTHTARVLVEY